MSFKIHTLHVCGPKDKLPKEAVVVNTTSCSKDFGRAFSPFLNQGDIKVGPLTANNVENIWQFSKVFPQHVQNPKTWLQWRNVGFADNKAHRYPLGKEVKAEFSWPYINPAWDKLPNLKLDYISARKQIYIPAYRQKLEKYCTKQVQRLVGMLLLTDIYLWDFDGYLTTDPFNIIVNNKDKTMGHAFVLKKAIADELHIEF